VFYDRSGPADWRLLHFNGVNLLRFILSNPQNPPFLSLSGDTRAMQSTDERAC